MGAGMAEGAASDVLFGWNPLWVSTCVLAITYAIIISEKINRSIVALLGAGLMVVVGVMDQEEALEGVDWNTIGLLTGMMILVSISRRSGMFQCLAIWSAQAARAHPAGILFMLQITTAVLSAFLDNVTTVLLVVPVTLAITKELEGPALSLSLRGDFCLQHRRHGDADRRPAEHPDRLAGRSRLQRLRREPDAGDRRDHAGADADDPSALGAGACAPPRTAKARVMDMIPREAIMDPLLLRQSLAVLGAVVVAFVLARPLHLEPATIAMLGAGVLMLLDNWTHHNEKAAHNIHQTFGDVEWITIFFFIGLFIVVHGVEVGGLLALLGDGLVTATGGDLATDRLRHPLGVRRSLLDRRQHPLRRHDDPADQDDGAGLWRRGRDPAALVVPFARRVPRRQRHADRRVGQSLRGRHRRAERRAVPLRHLHALRLPDDAGVDRYRASSTSGGAISDGDAHVCVLAVRSRLSRLATIERGLRLVALASPKFFRVIREKYVARQRAMTLTGSRENLSRRFQQYADRCKSRRFRCKISGLLL